MYYHISKTNVEIPLGISSILKYLPLIFCMNISASSDKYMFMVNELHRGRCERIHRCYLYKKNVSK